MNPKLARTNIMGIPFVKNNREELLQQSIYPRLREGEKQFIVTANPEIVMRANEDPSYKERIQQADYVLPDGAGIVIASKWLRDPVEERITGFDLMCKLLDYAQENGLSCYFLGAKEEVNTKMIGRLIQMYPKLKIAGYHHGYITLDDETIVNEMKETKPDLVFVALGFPRQEEWIHMHYHKFEKGLFMGVGGSFDVLAGVVDRAPKFWIRLNMEWFYRLVKQPFRWKRVLKVFEFMLRIIVKKY
ncbi:WecB/TagA/CpsF family glycosyltransferase [Salirhabdus salicampi]|uniref:WecB/TagA/CpsF family glycosyltransferase n=1 Tax=Salirhabdus salicampi TaxID=476102 RepID=UPI0020C240CE|nr:WecB/TagA/CpsF family glycosyltransferase [Salirhabdus salicampi]MCP8617486.1 WecB/TagA/CpsF family glycosyltransferase [Salirhabdus salicampi]